MKVVHLDSAADARCTARTIDAVWGHLRLEAASGGYVAEAAVADVIARLRGRLGELIGHDADSVALTESATAGLGILLSAWPLPAGATVGVAPGEWGPNLDAFTARGLAPTLLPVDDRGLIDLPALERVLANDPPDVVHLVQVAAHRALVQPGSEVTRICRAAGVPVWVDAAQALGHVDMAFAPDALYGTSRKWLRGPRGVGIVAVADRSQRLLRTRSSGATAGVSPIRTWESAEAAIAARVGLATAVDDLWAAGVQSTYQRLAEVGSRTRSALGDVPGWALDARSNDPPTGALTSVRPTGNQDVTEIRDRLLEDHRILVTATLPWRAPLEAPVPSLRISPHVEVADEDLSALAGALRGYR